MKETMKPVSHQQASQLLHNKFVVVLGDSIQRAVYKDLVLLLQKDKYLSLRQLRSKGEMSFEQDCLVEGGCLSEMHNGTAYREVRQFQSAHHLVRFYFVTRVYSSYMKSILEDFRHGLKPDVIIMNSCVWDISRYNSKWMDDYKENLHKFFGELKGILPEETLVVWNLTMPLGESIKGGFLVPEIEHKAPQLRYDVIDGNFYSGTLADAYGMDVLDLHFQFRFSLRHRTNDGVHWNAIAHRRITCLLLQHTAQAWGVHMPCPVATVEPPEVTDQQSAKGNATKPAGVKRRKRSSNHNFTNIAQHPSVGYYDGYREEFFSDSFSSGYMSFENYPQKHHHEAPGPVRHAYRPFLPPPHHLPVHGHNRNGYYNRPPLHFGPYSHDHHQHVMRSRHMRHHFAPYFHPRFPQHGNYY
ncbi:PC-esterase domain-containing protein 1A-like isoform X1 [Centropristis striata]|uniref:PC-esterase domain-containing protein 1A-like isoform X1 n=1 Tax=Centropristis striata TaxID=184440 RepID=UPI0027DFCA19|nr:PC-esterase domain-containing protein 1A-like isoform X1 [Centropristis striata]